mgnify:CR=1 FL=1
MYYVTKTRHIRASGGRSVVLSAGPRGQIINPITEESENLDAKLVKALPPEIFKALLKDGTIEERPDAA